MFGAFFETTSASLLSPPALSVSSLPLTLAVLECALLPAALPTTLPVLLPTLLPTLLATLLPEPDLVAAVGSSPMVKLMSASSLLSFSTSSSLAAFCAAASFVSITFRLLRSSSFFCTSATLSFSALCLSCASCLFVCSLHCLLSRASSFACLSASLLLSLAAVTASSNRFFSLSYCSCVISLATPPTTLRGLFCVDSVAVFFFFSPSFLSSFLSSVFASFSFLIAVVGLLAVAFFAAAGLTPLIFVSFSSSLASFFSAAFSFSSAAFFAFSCCFFSFNSFAFASSAAFFSLIAATCFSFSSLTFAAFASTSAFAFAFSSSFNRLASATAAVCFAFASAAFFFRSSSSAAFFSSFAFFSAASASFSSAVFSFTTLVGDAGRRADTGARAVVRAVRAVAGAEVVAVDDAVVGRDAVVGLRAEMRDELSALVVEVSSAEAVEVLRPLRALTPPALLPTAVLTGLVEDSADLGAADFFAVFFSSPVAESVGGLSVVAVPLVRELLAPGNFSLETAPVLVSLATLLASLSEAPVAAELAVAAGAVVDLGAVVAVPLAVPFIATAAVGLFTGAVVAAALVEDAALGGEEDVGVAEEEVEAEVDRRGMLEAVGDCADTTAHLNSNSELPIYRRGITVVRCVAVVH